MLRKQREKMCERVHILHCIQLTPPFSVNQRENTAPCRKFTVNTKEKVNQQRKEVENNCHECEVQSRYTIVQYLIPKRTEGCKETILVTYNRLLFGNHAVIHQHTN